ncbi:MAG: hypothetical protein GC166_14730 [Alphaproteobacteria bacterium]|nr:hypothetical protein [Alphaproteobacteria bacterium]
MGNSVRALLRWMPLRLIALGAAVIIPVLLLANARNMVHAALGGMAGHSFDSIYSLILCIAFPGAYAIAVRYTEGRVAEELSFSRPAMGLTAGLLAGAAICALLAAVLHDLGMATREAAAIASAIFNALTLSAAIEVAARGIVFRLLMESFGTAVALIVTALPFLVIAFGGDHASGFSVAIAALISGMVPGALYVLTRSLWPGMAVQAAWLFALRDGVPSSLLGGTSAIAALAIALALTGLLLSLIIRRGLYVKLRLQLHLDTAHDTNLPPRASIWRFMPLRLVAIIFLVTLTFIIIDNAIPQFIPADALYPMADAIRWTVSAIAMLLAYVWIVWRTERRKVSELALPFLPVPAIGLLAFVAFVVVFAPLLLEALGVSHETLFPAEDAIGIAIYLLKPAIYAELITRGALYRLLEESFGTVAALVLMMFAFGAVHAAESGNTLEGTFSTMTMWYLLPGALFTLTHSLWAGIGLHLAIRFAHLFIFGDPNLADTIPGGDYAILAGIASLIAAALVLHLAMRRGRYVPPRLRLFTDGGFQESAAA